MHVHLICLGTLKEDYLKAAQQELLGSLLKKNGVRSAQVIELKEEALKETASPAQTVQALKTEGRRILEKIPPQALVVCLDIGGAPASRELFARIRRDLSDSARQDLVFVIGGSWGISREVKAKAHHKVSFSRLTYPHQLFRIALLDALVLYL